MDTGKPRYLAPGPSVALDLIRILAALTVAVGHLSQSRFTTGWPPSMMDLAAASVAVFFVLSGFVIRYITTVKKMDPRRYAVDRFARIYSVAIPAILLTILFDTISAHASHAWYYANFVGTLPPAHGDTLIHTLLSQNWLRDAIRIFLNLTMLSQSWFQDISPLSNSPFWSLAYECVYYALFGFILYLRGSQRILVWLIVFLFIGPTVFLMFPLWLLGCATYDAYENGFTRGTVTKLIGFSLLSLLCVHGSNALVAHLHIGWLNVRRVIVPMDVVAIATAAILLPLCIAIRDLPIPPQHPLVRAVQRLGNATFPLYLIHFPLFVLLAATVPYPRASLLSKLGLLTAALALSLLLSGPCDSFKNYLRRLLLDRIAKNAPVPKPESIQSPAEQGFGAHINTPV